MSDVSTLGLCTKSLGIRHLILESMKEMLYYHGEGSTRWDPVRAFIALGSERAFDKRRAHVSRSMAALYKLCPMNKLTLDTIERMSDKNLVDLFKLIAGQAAKQL